MNQESRILELNDVIENEERSNNSNKCMEDMNTLGAATQMSLLTLEEKYSVFFLVRDSRNLYTESPVFTFFSTTDSHVLRKRPLAYGRIHWLQQ